MLRPGSMQSGSCKINIFRFVYSFHVDRRQSGLKMPLALCNRSFRKYRNHEKPLRFASKKDRGLRFDFRCKLFCLLQKRCCKRGSYTNNQLMCVNVDSMFCDAIAIRCSEQNNSVRRRKLKHRMPFLQWEFLKPATPWHKKSGKRTCDCCTGETIPKT